jgi:hypothetical protein
MSNKSDKPEASAISGVVGSLTEKAREAVRTAMSNPVSLVDKALDSALGKVVPGWEHVSYALGLVCDDKETAKATLARVRSTLQSAAVACLFSTSMKCGYKGMDIETALAESLVESMHGASVKILIGSAFGLYNNAASNPGEYIKRV